MRFRNYFLQAVASIRDQAAVFGSGTVLAYKGNNTGERSRKKIRQFAREAARQKMRQEREDA